MDPQTLKFTKSHEWIVASGNPRKVGISAFAQEQLGDLVYVEYPDEERTLAAGDEACVIESCKATASVYAPLPGVQKTCNQTLVDSPEKINESSYEDGWLFELEVADGADESALMDFAAYERFCKESV